MKHKPSETVSAQNGESEQMAGALWVMALLVKMIMIMIMIEIAMTRIFNKNEFYHSSRFGKAVKHRSGEQSGEEISTGFGRPEIVIIVR